MGADDMHGRALMHGLVLTMPVARTGRPRCYRATVNEPETITVAKPVDRVWRSAARGPRPLSNGAELGSVRKCRIALRSGAGDSARPQFPDPGAFLPVPHRPVRRRQDVAAAPVVPVASADAGLVNLFGHDISQLGKDEIADLRKRIGIVLQDFRLLDHMTTYENVALPFRVMGRSKSSYRKEVIDLLRWVGLGERMDALPPILSGGEKQRAAIARAVISRPQLLLADEPTGSVDPTLGRRLLRLFIELNKSGTAVIIATHDIG